MKRMGNKKLIPLICSVVTSGGTDLIRLEVKDGSQLVNVSHVNFRIIGHLENYESGDGKLDLLFILNPNSTEYQLHGDAFNKHAGDEGFAYSVYLNNAEDNYFLIDITGSIANIARSHKFIGYAIFDEVEPDNARGIIIDY